MLFFFFQPFNKTFYFVKISGIILKNEECSGKISNTKDVRDGFNSSFF